MFVERHFSVKEIAEAWGVSTDFVRAMFSKEPDVLILGRRESDGMF
jgi:hypothetical protein